MFVIAFGIRATSRIGIMIALATVVLVTIPASGPVAAAAATAPYTPGYLFKMHDGSHYWDDSEQPLKYWINTGTIPTGLDPTTVVNEIKAAFQAWQDDTASYLTFSYQGTTTQTHSSSDDGYNVVYWGTGITTQIECWSCYYILTGRITDSDICLNSGFLWGIYPCTGKYDIRDAVTHAVGHFIGLDDVLYTGITATDAALTMHPAFSYNSIAHRSIEAGDKAGVRYLYGGLYGGEHGGCYPVASAIGSYQAGAGIDIGDIDGVTGKDMLCAWVDDPSGDNYIYYRMGKQISSTTGNVASWTSTSKWTTAIGYYTGGMDVALGLIDADSTLDVAFVWMDNPSGTNSIKYVIGWDLTTSGVPSSWSAVKTVTGDFGDNTTGLGVKLANVAGTTRPDMVVAWADDPSGTDSIRYIIGKDMDTSGTIATASWSTYRTFTTRVSGTGGCGLAVADFDLNGVKDYIFSVMEVGTGPGYVNKISYKIGWNVDSYGVPTGWTGWTDGPVGWIGTYSDGLGMACCNIDGYASEEVFSFWIDDPSDTNSCYYRVEWQGRVAYSHP